jgi:hypothetical protein
MGVDRARAGTVSSMFVKLCACLPYGLLYNARWKGVKSACLGGAGLDTL